MTMILHCRDAGFDCDAVIRADTVDEIISQVRPHAASEHGVEVDDAMKKQLSSLTRTE